MQYKPSEAMKFLQLMILSLSLVLLVPLLVVESSPLKNDNSMSNITRGSSLSSNDTRPYWLSPSGNIAFGFYQLSRSPDRYVVGIWLVKSSEKTRVWTANPNDLPLHKPSSILFTNEGKLVLRIIPDSKDKLLLPDLPEPASYAKMHDDGNFVLYGSDSQIVWESFDHPTDTILGGQKLRPGVHLVSRVGDHRLSVRQTDGLVAIYKKAIMDPDDGIEGYIVVDRVKIMSDSLDEDTLTGPVTLSLDVTGRLYLASFYDDKALKVLYQDEQKQQVNEEEEEGDYIYKQEQQGKEKGGGDYMYRATLSSKGRLNLHKERIDGHDDYSPTILLWSASKAGAAVAPSLVKMSVLTGVTLCLLGLLIP